MSPPRPPPDLARRVVGLTVLPVATSLHRFHDAAYGPIHFDRSRGGRFNAPDGSYGVFYAAVSQAGAFAETFLREPGRTLLPLDLLARKAYARFEVLTPLRLAGLHGPGLAALGATAEVPHGGLPYDTAQAWSQALHRHPETPDGIAYRGRHDDSALCCAIFDRGAAALEPVEARRDLDADWFWRLAESYGVGMAP